MTIEAADDQRSPVRRLLRTGRAARLFLLLLILCGLPASGPVFAKTPGEIHCYRRVCVRVMTVAETEKLIGKPTRMTASHYGDPSVDPFNRGKYTSNGELFAADDPTRIAAATFPDGTELLLRNPSTGKVSHVRVNDFGPFRAKRELDVTERVARDLGMYYRGVVDLEVIVVSAPTRDDVRYLYRGNRSAVPTLGDLGTKTYAETIIAADVLIRRAAPPRVAVR